MYSINELEINMYYCLYSQNKWFKSKEVYSEIREANLQVYYFYHITNINLYNYQKLYKYPFF